MGASAGRTLLRSSASASPVSLVYTPNTAVDQASTILHLEQGDPASLRATIVFWLSGKSVVAFIPMPPSCIMIYFPTSPCALSDPCSLKQAFQVDVDENDFYLPNDMHKSDVHGILCIATGQLKTGGRLSSRTRRNSTCSAQTGCSGVEGALVKRITRFMW